MRKHELVGRQAMVAFLGQLKQAISLRSQLNPAATIWQDLNQAETLKQPCFLIIYFNAAKQTIAFHSVLQKHLNEEEVLSIACTLDARAILLIQNRVKGSVIPTSDDLLITTKLINPGKRSGIDLLDHLIISSYRVASIRQMRSYLW
jgi:DNA repair protein RadC